MTNEELILLGIEPKNHDNNYKRLSWDEYFLNIAKIVSKRSHDSARQHGTVLVRNNIILCTGFNGYPSGAPDGILPNTRPEKNKFIIHSEPNAILTAAKNGIKLDSAIAYITGMPCSSCTMMLGSLNIIDWRIGKEGYLADEKELLLAKFWREHFKVKITQLE